MNHFYKIFKRAIPIFLVGCLTIISPTYAQWQQMGPEGTETNCFAFSGSNIFAGTQRAGIFLSTNNGSGWIAVNSGLTDLEVYALTVSGANIFAGTNVGGIFLSTNNGSTWTAVNSGLTDLNIRTLSVSGTNIFAGTLGGGVFLSTNNGSTWTAINSGLTNLNIRVITVSGANIFAGTNGGGVFLSTNNGNTWTAVNSGLTDLNIRTLSISGTDIFAGTAGGVFLSTNNGSTWIAVNSGLTTLRIKDMAISGTNVFIATDTGGVFLSTNNGNSWSPVNSGLSSLFISGLGVNGNDIFAGTSTGISLSGNNGSNWTSANSGINAQTINTLTNIGSDIFAGTWGAGEFLYKNSNWIHKGLSGQFITSSGVNGTDIYVGSIGGGVSVSNNNGNTWTQINTGLGFSAGITSLAIDGSNIFACDYYVGVFSYNGSTWSQVNTGITDISMYSLAISGTNIYVGTELGGVFFSTNGTTWAPLDSAKLAAHTGGDAVYALIVKDNNVFAGTGNGGIFMHSDTNWTPVNTGLSSSVINCFFENDRHIFTGTDSGVFVSNNNGKNWSAMNNGFPSSFSILSFSLLGDTLLAGSGGHSTWKTPLNTNQVSGNITYKGNPVSGGYVRLLGYDTLNHMYLADSVAIAPNGDYVFTDVYPGYYVAYANASAIPQYSTSIGTYYNPVNPTNQWDSAFYFSTTIIDTLTNFNIDLIDVPPTTGNGKIDGLILMGDGYKKKGDPLSGIDVGLGKKPSGAIMASTQTDSSGYYELKNISPGTYVIYVDIPGLPLDSSYQIQVTATDTFFTNRNFMADSTHIYIDSLSAIGIHDLETDEDLQLKIYPNPFTNNCTIEITLTEKSDITIEVFNLLGEIVYRNMLPQQHAGIHTINFSPNDNTKGLFLIRTYTNGKQREMKAAMSIR